PRQVGYPAVARYQCGQIVGLGSTGQGLVGGFPRQVGEVTDSGDPLVKGPADRFGAGNEREPDLDGLDKCRYGLVAYVGVRPLLPLSFVAQALHWSVGSLPCDCQDGLGSRDAGSGRELVGWGAGPVSGDDRFGGAGPVPL